MLSAVTSACIGNGNLGPTEGATALEELPSTSPTQNTTNSCSDVAFSQELWAPVLSNTCYGCHIQGGMAQQQQARFVLVAPTEPDYLAKNLASVRAMANLAGDGGSLLWLKPTGSSPHGGGTVLPVGSAGERALSRFIAADNPAADCHPVLATGVYDRLIRATPLATVRQAALVLAGRLPSATEVALTKAGKVDAALDLIIKDPQFDDLVHRVYNDMLLTDSLNTDNAPNLRWLSAYHGGFWYDNTLYNNVVASWGETQNAPQLIAHVIRNDRPFTEILTANYLMANPLATCSLLGANNATPYTTACSTDGKTPVNQCTAAAISFAAPDICREFLPIVPKAASAPVCGILTDLTWLTVVNTTPSNRNRHRAAFLMQNFLNLDPMTLGAQAPPDILAATATDPNLIPTLVNPQCVVCHQMLDGIGSSMRNWTATPAYVPIKQPQDIFPPALFGTAMSAGAGEDPLCWLGQQMAAHPGFARATVATWFTALTGMAPLDDPDPTASNYPVLLAMKLEQNAFLAQTAQAFAADSFNLRHMLEALIKSPYFTTTGIQSGAQPDEQVQANMFGHLHRRGPEQLNRVIQGLTGGLWVGHPNPGAKTPAQVASTTYLLNDFLVSYGGIDSRNATDRNEDMSSIMAAIASFMAVQVPCQRTAADFSQPQAQRQLFPYVELSTLPDNGRGTAAIIKNIQLLYAQMLGEDLRPGDPELTAAYALFVQVYNNHAKTTTLDKRCASGSITTDATHTLYAWMAVQSVLYTDMGFLYE